MCCIEANQHVDVVGHAAGSFREPAKPAKRAPEIVMELGPPFLRDAALAVFCAKDQMVMEAEVSGGHGDMAGIPPGCMGLGLDPVVSSLRSSNTG